MKVYVKTFGCLLNKRDSENIKGVLKDRGFELSSENDADIIIVNSCGVKLTTQSKIVSYIKSFDRDVYVGGCLPRMVDMTQLVNVKGYFDTNSILKIADQILEERYENFSDTNEERIGKTLVRNDKDILIVPISQGCLGNCNYCGTKIARGKLHSYQIKEIISEIRNHSFKKLYLTSQDNGCYGFDIGTNIVSLLREVVNVDKDFIVRVGMMNPEHVLIFLDDLIDILKNGKVMKFIHIPIQSGSDKVLKEMGRKYNVEDFKKIVSKFREEIPDIHVATDVIVGYPTETEEDFNKTIELLDWLKPEVLNVSKFTPRPGTVASKLNPIYSKEIKRRSRMIFFKKY